MRHHDVELAILDKVLLDVHHVGVLQLLHHLDLVANLVDGDLVVLGCGARGGLHDLDGVFLARGLVHRAPHHRVPAGSEHRLHIVNVLDPAQVFDARLRELYPLPEDDEDYVPEGDEAMAEAEFEVADGETVETETDAVAESEPASESEDAASDDEVAR